MLLDIPEIKIGSNKHQSHKRRIYTEDGNFILLSETSTLTIDPTQKYHTKVKQVFNELSDNLLKKHESFYLKSMNPKIPILYGLPKIHKINTLFRPIASYVNTPSYKICKYLNTVLYESFHPKHSVKIFN